MGAWSLVLTVLSCAEELPACELAQENECPLWESGAWHGVTCTFGDVSATASSRTGTCEARGELYEALCDQDAEATAEEIHDGTVCLATECVVWYDPCVAACVPHCVDANAIPYRTCDGGCTDPAADPGECAWDATNGCNFVGTVL